MLATSNRSRLILRAVLAIVLAVGLALGWRYRGLLDPAEIHALVGAYPFAPLVFILLHGAASILFVPRTVMGIAAGLLFGFWAGFVWATAGCLFGALLGFGVARWLNAGLLDLEAMPGLGPMLMKAERGGWRSVAALRFVPILPHPVVNYALGLTKVPLSAYLIGSMVGLLPMTFLYVDIGAAGGSVLTGRSWIEPTLIGVGALLLSLVFSKLASRLAARWS